MADWADEEACEVFYSVDDLLQRSLIGDADTQERMIKAFAAALRKARREGMERCRDLAHGFGDEIVEFWDRGPNSPPGNGRVPTRPRHIADGIQTLIDQEPSEHTGGTNVVMTTVIPDHRCPVEMDDNPTGCSAGTCFACIRDRLKGTTTELQALRAREMEMRETLEEADWLLDANRSPPPRLTTFKARWQARVRALLATQTMEKGRVQMTHDQIPRRVRRDLCTPAENAIRAAVDAVETLGAHPLLTDAVIMLDKAREKVADYIEGPGERIERAAIRMSNGDVYSVGRPGRHHDVIAKMRGLGFPPPIIGKQGFITSTGRFIDRVEAMQIAEAAGQIKTKTGPDGVLFTEDMW